MVNAMNQYPKLFSPLTVNKTTYRNRIMCSPMVFGASVVGNQYNNAAAAPALYLKVERPARGGAGVVSVGEVSVNSDDAKRMPLPDLDFSQRSGPAFDAIAEYARRIHSHGAAALIELCHPGSAKPPIPGTAGPWGPAAVTRPDGVPVTAMDQAMMDKVCRDFAHAARFMQAAGFDGVVIHAGHGFLFTQFLSARTNTRTDEYGGSLENRARFPLRILKSVREAVGDAFILEARISGREKIQGGMEVDEVGRFCHMAEPYLNAIHVSSGLYFLENEYGTSSTMYHPHGYNAPLSQRIKSYVSIPVGVVGGINSPGLAEQLIEDGKADYVVLGRQMIADPDFANKAAAGRSGDIRQCVRCFQCFSPVPDPEQNIPGDGVVPWLKVGRCALNPIAGTDIEWERLPPIASPKRVAIAGGGPAGMQAAITAADRGHSVILLEQRGELGGTLWFTDVDVDKGDLAGFKNYLIRQVGQRDIEVRLNCRADAALLRELRADAVLLATGAVAHTPPIPGLEHAIHALSVYEKQVKIGRNIVMIGGGLVGCETGLHLAKLGHHVTVIDPLMRMAHESCGKYRNALIHEMEKCQMKSLVKTRCREVRPDGVLVENACGEEQFLPADTVVFALGMRPNLDPALADMGIPIGDCDSPAKVAEAVKAGFEAAIHIL